MDHNFKFLLIITAFFASKSFAQIEVKNLKPSHQTLLCQIEGHPVYDKTMVFGSGELEIYFARKDRKESAVHHSDFQLFEENGNFSAIKNETSEVLFYVSSEDKGFVRVIGVDGENGLNMETANYPVSSCLITNQLFD